MMLRNMISGRTLQLQQHAFLPSSLRKSLFTKTRDSKSSNVVKKQGLISRMIFGEPAPPPPPPKQSLLSRIFFGKKRTKPWFKMGVVAGGGSVLMVMYSIRRYRDSLVMDYKHVHQDQSKASISSAKPQVVPTVKIVTSTSSTATIVDEDKYNDFVKNSVVTLLASQKEMEEEASRLLSEKVSACFDKIEPRSAQFADWYFSYTTSFKLIQEATLSLARHAAKVFEETPINEAVAADMDRFMSQKYERIVLRPEINNSEMMSSYLQCVKDIHARYLQVIQSIDSEMCELVDSQTTHLKTPQTS